MTKEEKFVAIANLKRTAKMFEDAGYNAGMYYLIIDAIKDMKEKEDK